MIEICIKYDNMLIFGIINAFKCINNHVIDVKNSMLSASPVGAKLHHVLYEIWSILELFYGSLSSLVTVYV